MNSELRPIDQQHDLDRHDLQTEPWKSPVRDHRQATMRGDRLEVACAVRILGL